MSGAAYKGPKLPKALLDQFGGGPSSSGSGARDARTRKDRRKLERTQKKADRCPQRSRTDSRNQPAKSLLHARQRSSRQDEPSVFARDLAAQKPSRETVPRRKKLAESPESTKPPEISTRDREKLAEDEADIASLEKKLGIKSKRLPKSFGEDGLSELLGDLDEEDETNSSGGHKRKRADDEAWLQNKRSKGDGGIKNQSVEENDSTTDDDDIASLENPFSEDELGESELESDLEEGDSAREEAQQRSQPKPAEKRKKENPYVAPESESTSQPAKYVPPSLRQAPASDQELKARLHRQVQGLLNRLSEANMLAILADVERLYTQNPRQYVNETLVDLLLTICCDRSMLSDTFIILHAGFISALYKCLGTDFGAQILQGLVDKFDTHYSVEQDQDGSSSKEVLNLMSLLSQLYNFQMLGSVIVFDYVRLFLTRLSEAHTELLLRIIRASGPQLRQDDPSALKEIAMTLQTSISNASPESLSVRTHFMVETIGSLKDNRMKTGAAGSALMSEHISKMKKTLGSLNSRTLKATEPLRVGLADIRNTEKKGRWWLVGASWKGADTPASSINKATTKDNSNSGLDPNGDDDDIINDDAGDLLALAKQQRMNTDIRRAIFITVMSATDYKDAHLRLLKLRLTRSQELQMPHVLLHCAGAEAQYNPYYTLISRKLCGEHKLRMAFQFALWDLFKRLGENSDSGNTSDDESPDDIGSLTTTALVNYAKLYGDLIASGGQSITVLKALDLLHLQRKTKTFVEVLLVTVIRKSSKHSQHSPETALASVFDRALEQAHLAGALRWFLKTVVAKTDLVEHETDAKQLRSACKSISGFLSQRAVVEE